MGGAADAGAVAARAVGAEAGGADVLGARFGVAAGAAATDAAGGASGKRAAGCALAERTLQRSISSISAVCEKPRSARPGGHARWQIRRKFRRCSRGTPVAD